jgi:hypothetical protein
VVVLGSTGNRGEGGSSAHGGWNYGPRTVRCEDLPGAGHTHQRDELKSCDGRDHSAGCGEDEAGVAIQGANDENGSHYHRDDEGGEQ